MKTFSKLVLSVCLLSGTTSSALAEELHFGDRWKPFYKNLANEEPDLMPKGWRDAISLPPPPGDDFTRLEVQHIIDLKKLRRRYQVQIEAQIDDIVHPFVNRLGLDEEQASALRAFWDTVSVDITRVHMYFKAKFDRARPRQYSRKVTPSIDPPGHPAYPSGHSTDAHTMALLLAEFWPEKKTLLLSIAYQIALNREIAGVHYRSDTSAGYLLAEQITRLISNHDSGAALIVNLKQALLDNGQ